MPVAQGKLKSFDRVADCYDATRALPPEAESAAVAGIMRALTQVAPRPALLEVGIGTGRIAVPLAGAGARVVGIDIAPAMLARLRAKRADLPVMLAEASRLPFRAEMFDGALFVHVLHLLPDARAALAAATRVVRPGGMLLYGRTGHGQNARSKVHARLRELARELTGEDLPSGAWHKGADRAFTEHAHEIGARVTDVTLARWRERRTGRETLAAISGRVYSGTWAIPEAVMPELLRRLTPWTAELFGGLDRPVEDAITFALVMARVPA